MMKKERGKFDFKTAWEVAAVAVPAVETQIYVWTHFGIPWFAIWIFLGAFTFSELVRPQPKIEIITDACANCMIAGKYKTCTHPEYMRSGLFGKMQITRPPMPEVRR